MANILSPIWLIYQMIPESIASVEIGFSVSLRNGNI
jgi:hypothetical protein